MPAPNLSNLARVRVAATLAGTYATVAYVRSGDFNRGSDGATLLQWLGGEALRPGSRTVGFSFPVYWANDDTLGQTILENAWANGTTVGVQICPVGTLATAKVYQFEAAVDEANISFDSEGDAVEGTFSGTGKPSSYSVVTLV